jgi:hypothetical protein
MAVKALAVKFVGRSAGSLTVAGEDRLARLADLRTIGLQTAQDTENVVRINLQLDLAILGHVWVAGGAFLVVALSHAAAGHRRRLRRQILSRNGRASGKQSSE